MEFTSFIGIDISKNTFDAAVLNQKGECIGKQNFNNNRSGFKKLSGWINRQVDINSSLFCLEHSGIYCLPICVYFEDFNFNYSIQPGLQIKRSMGIQRGKNDATDAFIIARYAYLYRDEIECHKLPSKAILKLKQLLSYRERLVKSKVSIKTSAGELEAFADKELSSLVVSDSKKHLAKINESILKIDKALKRIIEDDQELSRLFELTTSVKGVGLQIAANLLVATHGFTRFKNWRKFSCYCGLAPFEYSSGISVKRKTKVSHLGNKKIKAIIGNGIASAIQNDPEIAAYYKRKLKEGKHKMVVMNAVKNKLVSRVFAVVKRGTPFVPLYQHS